MKYDEIHYWSEVKLDIVCEYASSYSRILTAQKKPTPRAIEMYPLLTQQKRLR